MLKGTEVKSLRQGKASLNEAFVLIDNQGEAWLNNLTIPHYEQGNIFNHEETRRRKLLLSKAELKQLQLATTRDALTIVPTILYFKKSLVKVEIATAKGKKLHDKRQAIAERESQRKIKSYEDI